MAGSTSPKRDRELSQAQADPVTALWADLPTLIRAYPIHKRSTARDLAYYLLRYPSKIAELRTALENKQDLGGLLR